MSSWDTFEALYRVCFFDAFEREVKYFGVFCTKNGLWYETQFDFTWIT